MAINDKTGSERARLIPVAAMALLLMLPSALLARESTDLAGQEKAKEDSPPRTATVVPGAALKIGAAMEGAAPPAVVKWARSYAKRELLKTNRPMESEVAAAVLASYPKAPEAARDAGEFLLWYIAYQEGTKSQETAAQRVRDIERDMGFLNDDLRSLRTMPFEMEQAGAVRAAEDRLLTRLYSAERQREMHKRIRDDIGARVDACIDRLAALSESRKDRDPAEIRNLK